MPTVSVPAPEVGRGSLTLSGFSGGGAAGGPTGVQRRARDRAAERPVPGRRWSCGDSNPGPSHCEGVSSPSVTDVCVAGVANRPPGCPVSSRGGTGGARDVGPSSRSGHPPSAASRACTAAAFEASKRHRWAKPVTEGYEPNLLIRRKPDFVQVVPSGVYTSSRWSSRCRGVRDGSYIFPTDSLPHRPGD